MESIITTLAFAQSVITMYADGGDDNTLRRLPLLQCAHFKLDPNKQGLISICIPIDRSTVTRILLSAFRVFPVLGTGKTFREIMI